MSKNVTCLVLNIVFVVIFVCMYFSIRSVVDYFIKMNLKLSPESSLFETWSKPPIPIYVKFYLFDVQNPDDVEFSGAKPVLVQKGPYTFLQKRVKKVNQYLQNNELIRYHEYKYFHFDRKKSAGPLSDQVTVANIPLVVMAHRATTDQSEDAGIMYEVVESLLKKLEPPLFENHTVDEMLFKGYHVELFEEMATLLKGFNMDVPDKLAEAKFGLMYKKNGSHNQEWVVGTGEGESKTFFIHSWNGSKLLPFWKEKRCNLIKGTDGSGFEPFLLKTSILKIFDPDICRSASLVFKTDSSVLNIPTFRFQIANEFFAPKIEKFKQDVDVLNDNGDMCFCGRTVNDSEICQKKGVFDLSGCAEGAPLALSQPHFLDADTEFIRNMVGIKPARKLHETYVDIEPNTGAVINALRRIQINVEIKQNSMPGFNQVRNMLLPVVWIEEVWPPLHRLVLSSATIGESIAVDLIALNNFISGSQTILVSMMIICFFMSVVCFVNCWTIRNQNQPKINPRITIKEMNS